MFSYYKNVLYYLQKEETIHKIVLKTISFLNNQYSKSKR